ncbi:MAG: ankyrin repeat domain-containing protein [Bacteroidales bacterium]|nr:ankyrin repeat domain-containing protein [Bacteroidales bacterium]
MKKTRCINLILSAILILWFQVIFAGSNEDLISACKMGDLTAATKAIDGGADVNFMDENGNTPIASAYFWPEITQLLLDKGADPNKGNYPALISACSVYSVDVVEKLLNAGADPNKTGLSDPSVTFKTLIANEKAKGKDANKALIKAWEGAMASLKPSEVELMQVIVMGTNAVPCLRMVIEKGASLNLKSGDLAIDVFVAYSMSKEERKNACTQGAPNIEAFGIKVPDWYKDLPDNRIGTATAMLDLLVNAGSDLNKPNSLGLTPLVVALKGCNATPEGKPGKMDVVNSLIENGADPKLAAIQKMEKGSIEYFPICLAAEFGDVDMMSRMIDKGADINTGAKTNTLSFYNGTWGGEGYTPLIIAIMINNFELANFLLDQGADIKIGSSGFALLDIADSENKATISTKNKTPIYWAIDKGDMDLIKKISDKMDWSFNPDFSYKAYEGDLVMQTGWGPLKLKGKNDLSPAMYADIIGNKEAKKFLLK